MRNQTALSVLVATTLTLTACSSLFSSSGSTDTNEERVSSVCESTDTNTLASQTDRRWYAESCSELD